MLDKNGFEMRTGDVVRISGAYFKNDNGLYFIDHSPGDPSWSGRDYGLKKILRNGNMSKSKYSTGFWPIAVFTNDYTKNAQAKKHNAENACIEIVRGLPVAGREAHFNEEIETAEYWRERAEYNFGADNDEAKRYRTIADYYRAVIERLHAEG